MSKVKEKFITSVKKNALYIVLVLCLLAVGLSVIFMAVNENKKNTISSDIPVVDVPVDPETPSDGGDTPTDSPDVGQDQPVIKPVEFIMPVQNATKISEYSDTMVWNSTLNHFSAHTAVDFFAQEGTPVYAVYGGVVESVTTSLLKGVTVTIDHGNDLKTVYNSLSDDLQVVEGQSLNQGDLIGSVSSTNRQEYKEGAHLHFEVIEKGEYIDPVKYLSFNEK